MKMFSHKKEKLYSFVMSREQPEGGFSFAKTTPATLEDTYYALLLIYEMQMSYNNKKTNQFLLSIDRKTLTIKHLFQLAQLRKILNLKIPYLDEAIQKYSFDKINDSESMYYASNLAVVINDDKIIKLLKGIVSKARLTDVLLSEICWKSMTLSKLKLNFNKGKVAEEIRKFQGFDGGFSFREKGAPSFIEETYLAIEALMKLNQKPKNILACESFINQCRANNGAYGRQSATVPTLEASFKAIITLKNLKKMREQDYIK